MPTRPKSVQSLVPPERIQTRILVLRGWRVILDADLASLYGVPTKRLNEQIKRNSRRFPEDFMFQLTREELATLRSQFATSNAPAGWMQERGASRARAAAVLPAGRGGRRWLPYAFTEHGAVQAANVLNSETAIEMGVQVVRAFNQLRRMFADHRALAAKLAELEKRVGGHDDQLAAVVRAISQLAAADTPRHRRRIGFHQGNR